MRLHNTLSNAECIGKAVHAFPNVGQPWVSYQDGNDGEEDYYRDVFVGKYCRCAYMFGEYCVIQSYDVSSNTVTLYNENAEINADGEDKWDGVFTISYEQYQADFGLQW